MPMNGVLSNEEKCESSFYKLDTNIYKFKPKTRWKRGGSTDMAYIPIEHHVTVNNGLGTRLVGSGRGDGEDELDTSFELDKTDYEKVKETLQNTGSRLTLYGFSDKVEMGDTIQVMVSALSRYTNREDIDWDAVTTGNADYHKKDIINGRYVNASNKVLLVPKTGS